MGLGLSRSRPPHSAIRFWTVLWASPSWWCSPQPPALLRAPTSRWSGRTNATLCDQATMDANDRWSCLTVLRPRHDQPPSEGADKCRVHCQLRSLEVRPPRPRTFVHRTGHPPQDPGLGLPQTVWLTCSPSGTCSVLSACNHVWLERKKNQKPRNTWPTTPNHIKVNDIFDPIDEARKEGRKVHFASLMDISHLKNAELDTKHQKFKGRVVLRGDILKDDSGFYAAFTEQSSSASKMKTAKVMDIISRLPGSEFPDIWIRLPRHKWHKSRSNMADLVVPLKRNLYGHPLAVLLWERQFEKVAIGTRLGEGFQLGMLIRTPWKRVILIWEWGWHQIGWKETKHWSDVESTQ